MRRRSSLRSRTLVLLVLASIGVAACSVDTEVESTQSDAASTDAGRGGGGDGAGDEGGTPSGDGLAGAAPSTAGLPELDGATLDDIAGTLTGELDNGLRYLVRENDNPGGSAQMWLAIDAGSTLEDDDQLGGAHFLEHMLFNGTERFPENELIAVLRSFGAEFGADVNAYTSYDETVYQLTVPTDDREAIETALDVLADWLTAALIDPAEVEAERGVVLDEWRGRSGVDARVFDGIERLFFDGSPYADRSPIGTRESIETLTPEALRRFYDDWYRPDLASIIVVGDLDADAVVEGIEERFSPVAARGTSPERPELVVEPPLTPQAEVVVDPDVGRPTVFVTLPASPTSPGAAGSEPTSEAQLQRDVLEALAFDIIATRLEADVSDGVVAFDGARVDSSGFVRGLTGPEIVVDVGPDDLLDAVEAVLIEYARAARDGFTEREVERAVAGFQAQVDTTFAGRDSKQDVAYADEYLQFVLEGVPANSPESFDDLASEVLDRATPDTVAWAFAQRYANSAPHMFIATPEPSVGPAPPAELLIELASSVASSEVPARTERAESEATLFAPQESVEEAERQQLSDGRTNGFVAPTLLRFDNGAQVTLNRTEIVEGVVVFEARSPGGTTFVANADLSDALALPAVVADSGMGDLSPADLQDLLSGDDVRFSLYIEEFFEGMSGSASTDDLETLFALMHTQIVAPRVDEAALRRYVNQQQPFVDDPGLDPQYANYVALIEARYDDPRPWLQTPESLADVDVAGIERVMSERFGDVSDWSFALSGDLDIETAAELARRYIGTLPGDGVDDEPTFEVPPAPPGVVTASADAASGDQAIYTLLLSGAASADRLDDIIAEALGDVLTSRFTDVVREELGQSYSPFGFVQVGAGPTPEVQTYVSVTTGPELLDEVAETIRAELDRLRSDGPSDQEFGNVLAALREQLDLFSNEQINSEILSVLTDPGGNSDLQAFLTQRQSLAALEADPDLLRQALVAWAPSDQYIEVFVTPR